MMTVQAGEKASQNYELEVRNPGGHSSRPVKDNAIYHLAAGITRLSTYEFPVRLNDTTRVYFSRMADIKGGEVGAAMRALVRDPDGCEGRRGGHAGPDLERDAAHDLRGDDARGGARDQCAAAARPRQRQLPDLSGPELRGRARRRWSAWSPIPRSR